MNEHDDDLTAEKIDRPPSEGVRIIGAEEAARALEEGHAAGRQPMDQPRFGDVPRRPSGPRPAQRFPLPESVDPAEAVRRPPLARSDRGSGGDEPLREPTPGGLSERSPAEVDMDSSDAAAPEEPSPGAGVQMPHWTEPPTGEVPRILEAEEPESVADEQAWTTYAGTGPRWRDRQSDWADPDFEGVDALTDDDIRVGALDTSRSEHSDLFSFDEPRQPPDVEPAAAPAMTTSIPSRQPTETAPPQGPPSGGRNTPVAVAVGVGLGAVALVLFKLGPKFTLALVTLAVTLAAAEIYDVLRRAGYRPATLLGLAATLSIMLGTYAKGELAIPLVLVLTAVFTFCWYLFGVVQARATVNVAVTILAFVWVGVLGSFAALILTFPNREGIAFLLGAVIATVANDVGAWFFGSQMGSRPLMPHISPNKTVEGAVGGLFTSVLVSAVVLGSVPGVHPWTAGKAAVLGLVAWAVGTLGDLCESTVKRDLGIKDMGSLLPGHGGLMDRFDAMLFVLPATYYLVKLLNLG